MWLWRVKWRWVWLVWGVLVRTCHPGQTHQVNWLDLSKIIFWNHSTSSSILSKVLVQPWSLLLTKIKVYFYSRGSQIQCASIEHPSTLGPLLYFYLFWPLLYSIFSHFSHILFLHFVTWHSLWIAKWEFHRPEMRFWCGWGKTQQGLRLLTGITMDPSSTPTAFQSVAVTVTKTAGLLLSSETSPLSHLPETFCAYWRQQRVV